MRFGTIIFFQAPKDAKQDAPKKSTVDQDVNTTRAANQIEVEIQRCETIAKRIARDEDSLEKKLIQAQNRVEVSEEKVVSRERKVESIESEIRHRRRFNKQLGSLKIQLKSAEKAVASAKADVRKAEAGARSVEKEIEDLEDEEIANEDKKRELERQLEKVKLKR